jgi:hypothetical protein
VVPAVEDILDDEPPVQDRVLGPGRHGDALLDLVWREQYVLSDDVYVIDALVIHL